MPPLLRSSEHLDVVLVTETYPPEIGGAAMCLGHLVEALLARGHQVRLVRPRQSPTDSPRDPERLQTVLVPALPVPFHPGLRLGTPAASLLGRLLRLRRPDIIHIASEGPLGVSALSASRALGIPVSTSFHTNFDSYGAYYGLGGLRHLALWHLRGFHNRAACTLVPTAQTRERLRAAGFHNLVVLPRGIDTRLFSPSRRSEELRRAWGAGPEDLVVIHVGRLAPEKSLPLAVQAFFRLRQAAPRARFVLVGEGPERASLERQHPGLVFTGFRQGEDLATHYASADIFLFPSLTETFGNVILEAMASGLAVVAFDDAAAHEHVHHGESGLIVPRGRGAEFEAAAVSLAREPALVRRLGESAVRAVATVSWDSVGAAFEGVLLEVVRHSRARTHRDSRETA